MLARLKKGYKPEDQLLFLANSCKLLHSVFAFFLTALYLPHCWYLDMLDVQNAPLRGWNTVRQLCCWSNSGVHFYGYAMSVWIAHPMLDTWLLFCKNVKSWWKCKSFAYDWVQCSLNYDCVCGQIQAHFVWILCDLAARSYAAMSATMLCWVKRQATAPGHNAVLTDFRVDSNQLEAEQSISQEDTHFY